MPKKQRERGKKNRKYTEEQFKEAINAIKLGQMTCWKAAKRFGIPRTTLYDHQRDSQPLFKHIGQKPLLSDSEEDSLVAYMRWCEDRFIPFTYQLLKSFCSEILKLSSKNATVCHTWCQDFTERHGFGHRKARHVEASRNVAAASPDPIIEYYELLKGQLTALGISDQPERVWNADEKGWSRQQCLQQPVLMTKGKKQAKVRQIFTTDHITTMHCVNANGDQLEKQFIVFKSNIPTQLDTSQLPETWEYGTTESGFFNGDLFFEWFRDMFIPSIGRARPQALIYDAASCHYTPKLIRLAIEENIDIITLPAKTTAFLQPVDQILSALATKFAEQAYRLCFTKFEFLVKPNNFPKLLSVALKAAWPRTLIKEAFKRTGMFPPSLEVLLQCHQLSESCKTALKEYIETGVVAPVEVDSTPAVVAPAEVDAPAAVVAPAEVDSTPAVVAPAEVDSTPAVVAPAEVDSTPAVIAPAEVDSTPAVIAPAEVDSTPAVVAPAEVDSDCGECGRPVSHPCMSCITRDKKKSNVLFTAGLIDERLLHLLNPPQVPKPTGRSRLTRAKHVTGKEFLAEKEKLEKEREEKDRRKKERESQKRNKNTLVDTTLPDILPPKRIRNANRQKKNQPQTSTPTIVPSPTPTPRRVGSPTPTPRRVGSPTPTPRQVASPTPTTSGLGRMKRRARINYALLNEGVSDTEDHPQEDSEDEEDRPQEESEDDLEVCAQCNLGEDDSDEEPGWTGCDICPRWYHRNCLPTDFQTDADLSLLTRGQPNPKLFRCPSCPIIKLCVVCFMEGEQESDFATCDNCSGIYHRDCLPEAHYTEFVTYRQSHRKWYCGRCYEE